MTYNAHINSKGVLTGIDMSTLSADEYGSSDVQNINVEQEFYDNWQKYGEGYYVYKNKQVIINPEWDNIYLEQKKESKIAQNDKNRDKKIDEGVTYNDVLFDSDTDQKINLLAVYNTMSDTDTIVWYGKNNDGLLCTKEDLLAIGALITKLQSFVWETNAYIKEQIANATTIDELDKIDISYNEE